MKVYLLLVAIVLNGTIAKATEYFVKKVPVNLAKVPDTNADYWKGVDEISVSLLAQKIVKPKSEKTETELVKVQAVHDGKFLAFRMRWADTEKSEAGKLAEFSDAVALEFPVLDNLNPPPIFMGMKGNPVHLFHWRAQYQYDEEHGKKGMRDIYPNLTSDTYPNEYPDRGKLKPAKIEEQEMFSPGKAVGNPQSSRKTAVDELMAEGFGSSAVRGDRDSFGRGEWKNGEWTVVIVRALHRPEGSILEVGKVSSFGLAVWQGGLDEVGARKSLTMQWQAFKLGEK